MSYRFCWIIFLSCLFACHSNSTHNDPSSNRLLLLDPEDTGVTFENRLSEDHQYNIITFEYFYNGAGVGAADFNKDGWTDLFFCGNMVESKLYLNKGGFEFEDITSSAGITNQGKWATGVSIVDINQDGWPDIYVCFAGPYGPALRTNQFYINNKDNTFSEKAAELGLDDNGHSTQAAFFDYDLDGDLDAYLLTNITEAIGPNVIRPKKLEGQSANTDRLYKNEHGRFVNVSREAGILKEGYGLGVSITDINQDGWPDVYVSNDYLSNDLLYINNQNGTFTDSAAYYFKHTSYSAMGNDVGDINNDAFPDIIALDMLPPDQKRNKTMFGSINYNRFRSEMLTGYFPQYMRNTLQLNNGIRPGSPYPFSEIGQLAGVAATDWSWSALLADMDNDGWKDLMITNGYPRDITNMDFAAYKADQFMNGQYNDQMEQAFLQVLEAIEGAYLPNFAFRNNGDLTFENVSANWGIQTPSFSTGAVTADLDNDGDLDYVVNNTNGPAFIYQNHTERFETAHFLEIQFVGPVGNTDGFGTKVYCFTKGMQLFQEFNPVRGFQSTVQPMLHFGLGENERIDSLIIEWPDHSVEIRREVPANQFLTVKYENASKTQHLVKDGVNSTIFRQINDLAGINYVHSETHYADFMLQPLLLHKFSQDGPPIAVADVNGDGLQDFFIGGAYNQSGNIYIQQQNGRFKPQNLDQAPKYEEDLGAHFFDADGDHDADLYVVSGGSEFEANAPYYQDRLYFNDGKGNFKKNPDALPTSTISGSCVVASDYDGDGDLDLFVGGRVVPNRFPEIPASQILENRAGKFFDQTSIVCPDCAQVGMVTSAQWADLNSDKFPDLVIVGEWMPIKVFINKNGKLLDASKEMGLEETVGFWNKIAVSDLDKDGDLDLVAGNLGLNSNLKTSKEAPLRMYVNDFDLDEKSDAVITHFVDGVEYPIHFRNDMSAWMLPLRKKFPNYLSYATTAWKEMFPEPAIAESKTYEVSILASSWFENRGAAFDHHILPMEAQFAPVYGIVIRDFNQDGHPDILLSGNSYATETHSGQYDAFLGRLLTGDNKGNFHAVSVSESGFYIPGDGKSLDILDDVAGSQLILAAQNNGPLLVFKQVRPVN